MTDLASDGSTGEPGADPRRRAERALRAVRREGWKAALVHAVVDAAAVCLGVNLLLATLDPGWLPERTIIAATEPDWLPGAVGLEAPVAVPGTAIAAVTAGLLVFAVELVLRVRRPLVEQFEAANPEVAESLRTARDAVAAGADTPMAARLYEDVLDRLRETSGVALVDGRRLAATAAVIAVLSLATVQVAVLDLALFGGAPETDAADGEERREYTGLRDGDAVLGESESVSSGDDEIEAAVESTGGGREIDENREFPPAAGGGSDGASGVDSQQAGYDAPDRVEEADLVREYNRRIRDDAEGE